MDVKNGNVNRDINHFRLSTNALQFNYNKPFGYKDVFSLNKIEEYSLPEKILNNVKKKSLENTLDSVDLGFVFWIKQTKEIQVTYPKTLNGSKDQTFLRNFLFVEKDASLNWVEVFPHSNFKVETYIFLEDQASCHRLCIDGSQNSSFIFCDLKQKSNFLSLDIHFNSSVKNIQVEAQGEKSTTCLRSLNILQEDQKAEQFFLIRHLGEESLSRQNFKSLLFGKSQNSSHSKAVIQAQGSDSYQMLENLLIGRYAKAKNLPELEVKKDQVKASHGAVSGRPRALEIFYMKTRGLSEEEALQFLAHGWIKSIFECSSEELNLLPSSFIEFFTKIDPLYFFLKNFIKTSLQK